MDIIIHYGYIIIFLSIVIAYLLTKGKSVKRKYIIWGIVLMVFLSPTVSVHTARIIGRITHNLGAGILIMYIFPISFIIGLIMLLIGIFKEITPY